MSALGPATVVLPRRGAPMMRELWLYCPWPARANPRYSSDELDSAAADWYAAVAPSSLPRYDRMLGAGDLSRRLYPDNADRDAIDLATRHILAGTAYDDHLTAPTASAQHVRACVAAAQGLDNPNTSVGEPCPHLVVVRDLAERWRTFMSGQQWTVFAASWRRYLATVVRGRAVDGIDAYLAWRHIDEGSGVFTALVPTLNGYQPDRTEWDDPRLVAVRHAVGLVTGIDNDLAAPGEDESNAQIVDVLATEKHLDTVSAARETVALRDLLACRLRHLVDGLGDERQVTRGEQHAHFVAANLDWLRECARYRERSGRPFVALHGTPSHPEHDCDSPPPYPAVAWWWQLR